MCVSSWESLNEIKMGHISWLTGFKEKFADCSFEFFFIYQTLIDPYWVPSKVLDGYTRWTRQYSCLSRDYVSEEHWDSKQYDYRLDVYNEYIPNVLTKITAGAQGEQWALKEGSRRLLKLKPEKWAPSHANCQGHEFKVETQKEERRKLWSSWNRQNISRAQTKKKKIEVTTDGKINLKAVWRIGSIFWILSFEFKKDFVTKSETIFWHLYLFLFKISLIRSPK